MKTQKSSLLKHFVVEGCETPGSMQVCCHRHPRLQVTLACLTRTPNAGYLSSRSGQNLVESNPTASSWQALVFRTGHSNWGTASLGVCVLHECACL